MHDIVTLICSIIAAVCSLIVVFLYYLKDMRFYKLSSYKERPNNMYVPFYRAYCTGRLFSNNLTDYDGDVIVRIINLFNDNIHCLGTASQALFCNVYFNYAQWIVYKSMGLYNDECFYKDALDSSFNTLAKEVLKEYRVLLRKCRLPKAVIFPTIHTNNNLYK